MLENYNQALDYLNERKPQDFNKIFAGQNSLKRVKKALQLLDNPQEKIKVVHIAGTSGKGSTAYFTAKVLESAGFKVGLTISPAVKDFLERFQINFLSITQAQFTDYLNQIIPFLEQVDQEKTGKITFFEVISILAYYIFYKENVDYAVIETGLGGLLDASNTVLNPNKICIVTDIGYDHTEILGNKITQIAKQKAGIIQPGQIVFKSYQQDNINQVFINHCQTVESKLFLIGPEHKDEIYLTKVKTNEFGTKFNFHFKGQWINDIILTQSGDFQALNCSLALAACYYLSQRDGFELDESKYKTTLKTTHLPGRFEKIRYKDRDVILDMAHNHQKVAATVRLLQQAYPGIKFNTIFAVLSQKDYIKMLTELAKISSGLVLTEFTTLSETNSQALRSVELIEQTRSIEGLKNIPIKAESELANTLDLAIEISPSPILIVGSTYLIKEISTLINQQ